MTRRPRATRRPIACGLGSATRVRTSSHSRKFFRTKHVVAAGLFVWDAGSTPAASTSLRSERSEEGRLPRRSVAKAGLQFTALRATTRQANEMNFFYVYILESATKGAFYVGFTEDLQMRLKKHNAGEVPHTAKHRPWRIKTAIAFTDKAHAMDFENYLKSSSGRAFAKKRL